MRLIFSVFLFVFLSVPALATKPQEPKVQSPQEVAPGIYLIVSQMGGNVALSVGEDGVFMVDDQLTPNSEALSTSTAKVTDKPVDFLLNTHYHFDHTGGNEHFGGGGSVILAHDNVRKRLSEKQVIEFFDRTMEPLAKVGLPVITFGKDMTLHYNDDTVYITHAPYAHTDGDSIVFFEKKNVLVTGDLYFNGFYPFIDVDAGGSIEGVMEEVENMLARSSDDTVIIPGHGPVSTKAELKTYRHMLNRVYDNVMDLLSEGKTLEEIVAAKPTADFDAEWADGFLSGDQFTTLVHQSITHTRDSAVPHEHGHSH